MHDRARCTAQVAVQIALLVVKPSLECFIYWLIIQNIVEKKEKPDIYRSNSDLLQIYVNLPVKKGLGAGAVIRPTAPELSSHRQKHEEKNDPRQEGLRKSKNDAVRN